MIYGNSIFFNNQKIIDNKENINSLNSSNTDSTSWNCTWGTIGEDVCHSTTIDSSDNIYLAGYSTTNDSKDIAVIKYNNSGGKQWENLISVSSQENGKITLDRENNIYITYRIGDIIYLKKYDGTTGSKLWNYTSNIGEPPISEYIFTHLFDHLLITDTYNYTYLFWIQEFLDEMDWIGKLDLVKFNSTSGRQLWNCSRSGSVAFYNTMVIDTLNNIYLGGNTMPPVYFKSGGLERIIKYNSSGKQQWNETLSTGVIQFLRTITLDSLNNLYIVGDTTDEYLSDESYYHLYLTKYNEYGQFQWYKEWKFKECNWRSTEIYKTIAIDSSDNIYITGDIYSGMFLIKYDTLGKSLWNYTWRGGNSVRVKSIVIDSADNVYIGGESDYYSNGEYDIILFKFDSSGNLNSIRLWGGEGNEEFNSILLDSSGNVYIAGTTTSFGAGSKDMFLLKNPTRLIEEGGSNIIPSYDLFILINVILICLIYLSRKQLKLSK